MKPSWDDAPEWANWLAMDKDGTWFFWELKPISYYDGCWLINGGRRENRGHMVYGAKNWAGSRERRP